MKEVMEDFSKTLETLLFTSKVEGLGVFTNKFEGFSIFVAFFLGSVYFNFLF